MNTQEMTFEQLCELFAYTPKNRRLSIAEAAEVLGVVRNTLELKRFFSRWVSGLRLCDPCKTGQTTTVTPAWLI